ncbi:MAG TPA: flagellar filament capping protein FliD [candidate division Zixibacteria bacterium]|nr:flagellar filament capping protein FliD [candidate division Zixibacteria bacterium]MDD4917164.1 flagellar filament capping protein FliD [candidate division Zixibacteria bacterium]MDM7971630.1 flagellar filament capping protein FliD [candidate division Zixibacteria bacterium]HOD65806.1 flagellar filament capping protein FliD [candidate division Zixibacteria bacterium]HPM36129.1 flagellar filament capping protein FliD [candidate division Zixibacteria bacterium]
MAGIGSIDGIISGLNTTEIVDTIIKGERRNADLLEEEQAKKTAIISAFKALQAKFLALNTELAQLVRASSYEAAAVTVSDPDVLSATASGRVTGGSYDVQVLSLARNHQLAAQGFAGDTQALLGTGTIRIQTGAGPLKTITIDGTNNSLAGIRQAINDAGAGVTASIVNDGSSSNPYRLVLTADKTGRANRITVTSDLTGGANLNFATPSFDAPEVLSFAGGSTAKVFLGTTAAYTGTANRIYTFTVAGTSTVTVGNEPITLNWTDGTNSGAIVVTQADLETELAGVGSDGLKITLSAGILTGGDTFQVSTFAPTLQEASDARIAIGSQDGQGSPIVVTSATNTFTNVIGGLTLRASQLTAPGETVTVGTERDITAIRERVQNFIKRYNEVIDFIEEQNSYDQEADEAGILFGDATLWMVRNSLSNAVADRIPGIDSKFTQLYALGIRTQGDGRLAITDAGRFEEALRTNLDDVIALMSRTGSASRTGIEFVSSTAATKVGQGYAVDITQAATKGYYRGGDLGNLEAAPLVLTGSNNTLKITVDGIKSQELYLTPRSYSSGEALAAEIQARIATDENLGPRGVTVTWVSSAGGGYLTIASASYGSASKVTIEAVDNSAAVALGLAAGESVAGQDVAGTINGETAEGKGQLLTGKTGNATTDGLVLRVTLDETQVISGAEGQVTVTKGVAARLKDVVESLTKAEEGTFDRRIKSYQSQVDTIAKRVAEIDERLKLRRESLLQKYYLMEQTLGEMQSIGNYLESQLAGINTNWGFRTSKQ